MASELQVQTISGPPTGANANKILIPSGQTLFAPGHVIQVVNSILTTTMSWTGTTAIQNILSANITPKFSTSKILVQCHVQLAAQHGMQNIITLTMDRNGTKIAANTSGGATANQSAWGCYGGPSYADSGRIQEMFSLNYLDSPSTASSLTYTLGGRLDQGANTAYVGRWSLNNDSANVTTLTLMEIAA